MYYTASGIVTLKQVSGLKLLKCNSINMGTMLVKFMYEFFGFHYCMLLTVNIFVKYFADRVSQYIYFLTI